MIRGFVEQINSVGLTKMVSLVRDGIVSDYYVYVGPPNQAALDNRTVWNEVNQVSSMYVPMWGWYVCSANQAADVTAITALDHELQPAGWLLNIEKPLQDAKLTTLIEGVAKLGRPIVASMAGVTASHVEYDYRCLEKHGVKVDWQAYFDSGEGTTPAIAVQELYQSSFIIPGREYRHRWRTVYGWGKVGRIEAGQRATFDSYRISGLENATFNVTPREWGFTVVSRFLYRDGVNIGMLMGKAAYPNIRATLDVTRTAQARPAEEWVPIAGSARAPGAARRPISVYLVENARDDVLRAIAKGAP